MEIVTKVKVTIRDENFLSFYWVLYGVDKKQYMRMRIWLKTEQLWK